MILNLYSIFYSTSVVCMISPQLLHISEKSEKYNGTQVQFPLWPIGVSTGDFFFKVYL